MQFSLIGCISHKVKGMGTGSKLGLDLIYLPNQECLYIANNKSSVNMKSNNPITSMETLVMKVTFLRANTHKSWYDSGLPCWSSG